MSILKAIKRTIEYGEKYECQLTRDQLFERLISSRVYKVGQVYKVCKVNEVFRVNKILEEKTKKAEWLAKLIENQFKDILFLGITGSVAAGYPKTNDDIDLMVITKNNKLWWNRLKLRHFIYKNNIPHRKYGQKEKANDFCFNLWLDENNLFLPKNRQNLRNAVDLILVKPLINKNKTYEKFITINSWAKKWVATGYNEKISNFQFLMLKKDDENKIFEKMMNWVVFWPQFWYMKKRIKNEKIGLHKAFFHH